MILGKRVRGDERIYRIGESDSYKDFLGTVAVPFGPWHGRAPTLCAYNMVAPVQVSRAQAAMVLRTHRHRPPLARCTFCDEPIAPDEATYPYRMFGSSSDARGRPYVMCGGCFDDHGTPTMNDVQEFEGPNFERIEQESRSDADPGL